MMDMREKYAIFGQKKNVIQSGIRNKEFQNSNQPITKPALLKESRMKEQCCLTLFKVRCTLSPRTSIAVSVHYDTP